MAGDQRRRGAGVIPWRGGARRVRRSALAGPVAVLALLLAVLALPPVSSAFSARTVGSAGLAADQVLAPSNLAATQSCSASAVTPVGGYASTSPSPLALSPPATTQPGDLLLAPVAYYGDPTVPTPTGWTLLLQQTSGTAVTSAVYWKIATAGEPAVSFARTGSTGDLVGGIVAYRGVDRTSPFAGYAGSTGKDTPPTTPTFTTTATNTVLLHFLTKTGITPLVAPTGTTELAKLSSDSEAVTAAAEQFAGPGTTAPRTTDAGGVEWIAQSVLLRRAASVPTVQLTWTASPSSWATGYQLQRSVGGTVRATWTVDPVSASSASDGPRANGIAYSYQLRAYRGSWTSPPASVSITPSC
jgi:hypothetical protein